MRPTLAFAFLLALAGCAAGPDIAGTWDASEVTGLQTVPPGAKSEITFTKPDKFDMMTTMAAPAAPNATITATVTGTYKVEGESLTLTAQDAKVGIAGIPDQYKSMAEAQLSSAKQRIVDEINKVGPALLTWEGNDKVVAADKDKKVSMTLTRRKG